MPYELPTPKPRPVIPDDPVSRVELLKNMNVMEALQSGIVDNRRVYTSSILPGVVAGSAFGALTFMVFVRSNILKEAEKELEAHKRKGFIPSRLDALRAEDQLLWVMELVHRHSAYAPVEFETMLVHLDHLLRLRREVAAGLHQSNVLQRQDLGHWYRETVQAVDNYMGRVRLAYLNQPLSQKVGGGFDSYDWKELERRLQNYVRETYATGTRMIDIQLDAYGPAPPRV